MRFAHTTPPIMRRVRPHLLAHIVPLFLGSAVLALPLRAQQPGPPEKFENLKVFPKDIPRDSLLGIMRGFTTALGVNCQYCHVTEPAPAGAPGPRERLRPALDDKQTKLTARFMLRMVHSLNDSVLPALDKRHTPAIRVTCATCHHGSPLPQTTQAMMSETIERAGVDSAIASYRKLRGEMISGRYDFREGPINDLALSLATSGRSAEAIKLLEMNQEFFPSSADVDATMAEVYLKGGDKDRAITRYRAALVKRPQDPRILRRMQELGVAP